MKRDLLVGVAIHQIVAAVFHLQQRFFERDGFAALVMIGTENARVGRAVGTPRRGLAQAVLICGLIDGGGAAFAAAVFMGSDRRVVARHFWPSFTRLLLDFVERGAHSAEQVRIGTDSHQLVVVNVQRDFSLVEMAFAGHHHVGLFFPPPIHQLG